MLPLPNNGDAILFSYLWEQEHKRFQEEGLKDRPCVVVASFENKEGKPSIIVAPITHSPPKDIDNAIEVPQATKDRLGLDDERSWIITSEVNITEWPGYDIRTNPEGKFVLGALPNHIAQKMREMILDRIRSRTIKPIDRNNDDLGRGR